jgi:hypothetical protein
VIEKVIGEGTYGIVYKAKERVSRSGNQFQICV